MNFIEQLRKVDGAIVDRYDPHESVLRTPSPSVNWTFGNTHGLPRGFSIALWGKPKGGKSLIANAMVGQMHMDYPDVYAVKCDVEMRDRAQMSSTAHMNNLGIDQDRYIAYEGNKPKDVFDRLTDQVFPMCEKGMNLGLVIIDSLSMMQGRREAAAGSVEDHQIGDHAQTVQIGLKRILEYQRKYRFGLVCVCQARAEMDRIQVMRGHTSKMQASFGVQHHCEYFMMVEKNEAKAGRVDELGNAFEDSSRKDLKDKAEQTGHKIRVWMQDSSMGPANRTGEFTIDREAGIVNVHEEVFRLGVRWGIIDRPNLQTYKFGSATWKGKPACLEALRNDPGLQGKIVQVLMEKDQTGRFAEFSVDDAVKEIEAAAEVK